MVYNDTANLTGIIQAEESYCELGVAGISGNTNLLKEFTRHNNVSNSKIWSWIFLSGFGAQYDDGNQTNLPSATQDLNTSSSKYAMPSDALVVVGIEIADSNGNWRALTPTSLEELQAQGQSLADYGTESGSPSSYIWRGNTLQLDKISSESVTNGFKIFFSRGSVAFAYDDTTETPGFASEFHNAIAVGGALEWLKVHKPNSAVLTLLSNDWVRYEQDIKRFYNVRFRNLLPAKMTPKLENTR